MSNKNYLFSTTPWPSAAAERRTSLEEGIIALDGDRLLNTAIHDLSAYFAEIYKFDLPILATDKIVIDQREAVVEVGNERNKYSSERARGFATTGTLVEVSVPFEGDARCFEIQPTTFTFNLPRGEANEGQLTLHIEGVDLVVEQVRFQIQQAINDIMQNLRYLRSDCDRFNANLYSYAHALIQRRRKKLLSDRNLVADLSFKLKERLDLPNTFAAPEVRHRMTPVLPLASKVPYRPEPYLATRDFAHILDVLQHMAQVMQYTPSAFASMDEGVLPSHFLFQLNAHFSNDEVAATGREPFGYAAKRALSIEVGGKYIFLAQCRYWQDARHFTDALNQLLGYPSWRDTKAAILFFNRDKEFPLVLEAIQSASQAHPNFKRALPQLSKTTFPYVFAQHADRNREMLLTLLAFDLPK